MSSKLWANLTQESVQKLESLLPKKYPVSFEPHVTLDYGLSEQDMPRYDSLLGHEYSLTVSKICWDDYIEAILVDLSETGLPCVNKVPHITWSSTGRFHPFYSNYMLHVSQNCREFGPVEIETIIEIKN
jgi:hypothetical protein